MNEMIFDMPAMEKYLEEYDVLKELYFWDVQTDDISMDLMDRALKIERKHRILNDLWSIQKAQDAYLTVERVYDDEMLEHLGILQLVLEKFVGSYVGIEGIEHLFNSSYFYFEWLMHLEYNPNKHDYTYYRDHYMHQVKDMYEMLCMLDQNGFMKTCINIYKSNSDMVANHIKRSIQEQKGDFVPEEKALFIRTLDLLGIPSDKKQEELYKRMEEYCYRYLFHAVAIIAALVHDIGYPITYMLRTTQSLHEFLPISDSFIQLNNAMPHLEEILRESLLYKTVDSKEIVERVTNKQDHGAISAVILLNHYYENGAIYHLRPIEKMAIELSALAIYNHTLKYEYLTGDKQKRYRNIFKDNPISYLFRLCDDLQEWGRVYFDVSKRSNFLVCSNCCMPMTRSKDDKNIYSCICGDRALKRTQFQYRKLTNVTACDKLILNLYKEDQTKWVLNMHYKLTSQLQLAYYSPQFAKLRADDVYSIKRMLDGQRELPKIYVEAFLSNNPIVIKVRCLENFFVRKNYKHKWHNEISEEGSFLTLIQDKDMESQILDYLRKERESLMRRIDVLIADIAKMIEEDRGTVLDNYVKEKWIENLLFYFALLVIGEEIAKRRESLHDRDEIIELSRKIAEIVVDYFMIKDRPTRILIADYFIQKIRNVSSKDFFNKRSTSIDDLYYESTLSNQFMINTVKDYVGSDDYEKVKECLREKKVEDAKGIYDYYTDYELFHIMGNENIETSVSI